MIKAIGQTEKLRDFQKVAGIVFPISPGNIFGNSDVRARVECRQKIEFLEYESNLSLAHYGTLGIGKLGKVIAVYDDATRIRARQSTQQIKEGGLAATRRA